MSVIGTILFSAVVIIVGIILVRKKCKKEVRVYGEDQIKRPGETEPSTRSVEKDSPGEPISQEQDGDGRRNNIQNEPSEASSSDGETPEEHIYPVPDLE